MQQPCPKCGYITDRPARFCRQCGNQLYAETEGSAAVTQNYEARRTDGSAPASPRYAPAQDAPPETMRFYQPPGASSYPSVSPPYAPYPVEGPKSSKAAGWLIALALILLLAGGSAVGLIGYAIKSRSHAPTPAEIAQEEAQRAQEEAQRIREEAQQAIEEAQQAIEDASQKAAEAAKSAPDAPVPPLPPGRTLDLPAGLEKFKYASAKVVSTSSILGNDIVSLRTDDSIDKVREFYEKAAGKPIFAGKESGGEKYIFQNTATSPAILITIHPDEADEGKTSIQLVRSKFVPNLKELK